MKKTKYALVSLIDMENYKLDVHGLKRALLDGRGIVTAAWNNFGFDFWGERFEERDDTQKYAISAEIGSCKEQFYLICGQKGLFLKVEENIAITEVTAKINSLKPFIDFCKFYLFIPFGVAHILDGDYFIKDKEVYGFVKYTFKVIELFEGDTKHDNL